MSGSAAKPPKRVTSVAGAAAVLRQLSDVPGRGVNAIARATGLGPSSCFNILKTLVAEELASFDAVTKTYVLGPGLVRLAAKAQSSPSMIQIVRPRLDRFAARGLATSIWEVTASDRLVLAAFIESDAATRIHMSVGLRLPLLAGAMGRCLAAMNRLSVPEMKRNFAVVRWSRQPAFATYVRQVRQAGEKGWALDDGDFIAGITTVAAPVGNIQGVRMCISNSLFSGQASASALAALGEETAAAAKEASRALFGTADH